jgi:membrane protein
MGDPCGCDGLGESSSDGQTAHAAGTHQVDVQAHDETQSCGDHEIKCDISGGQSHAGSIIRTRRSAPGVRTLDGMSEVVARPRGVLATSRRLFTGTVGICFRHRVTGLAAEAAFFALVSLPPLALGVVGAIGALAPHLPADTVEHVRQSLLDASGTVLNQTTIDHTVAPLLKDVLSGGGSGFKFTVLGLALMLWSGSRWLNVYVDTITIMYGLDGRRHFLKTRALSFALYLVMLVVSIVLLPVLVIGPDVLGRIFPAASGFIEVAYWPVVVAASVAFLTSLYHVSVPVRTPWRRDLPGAAVALVIWVVGSVLLRLYLDTSVDSNSAYGSLAAPIAVLFWLYVTALAVLIGAGLNAVVDKLWPFVPTARARRQAAQRAPVQRRLFGRPIPKAPAPVMDAAMVAEPPAPAENPVTAAPGHA